MKKVNWQILFILALAALARLLPVGFERLPFMYDHAKDSLVIMDMVMRLRPALYGAVTSIDGVYNGPFYYYAALPFSLLLGFHPYASVLTIVAVSLLVTYAIARWVGRTEALLFAGSIGVVGSQQSAWSPYMTVLVMAAVMVLLWKYRAARTFPLWAMGLLATIVSLSFHFQTAFGVILAPLVVLYLLISRLQISWKGWLLAALCFSLPFTPFALFEVRHSFHQTKQIIFFLTEYGNEADRVQGGSGVENQALLVADPLLGTVVQALTPIQLGHFVERLIAVGVLCALIYWYTPKLRHAGNIAERREWLMLTLFMVGTFVAYQFLPFKPYYLVALIPVWIFVFGRVLRSFTTHKYRLILGGFFAILICIQAVQTQAHYRELAMTRSLMLEPKQAAVEKIYELAGEDDFSVYSFVPEIYDYTYQHLFLRKIMVENMPSPIEFSYAPGEHTYVPQRQMLKKKYPNYLNGKIQLAQQADEQDDQNDTVQNPNQKSMRTFLIIEPYDQEVIFDEWYSRAVGSKKIIHEQWINEVIKIVEVKY